MYDSPHGLSDFSEIMSFQFNRIWQKNLPKMTAEKVGYIIEPRNLTFMTNLTASHARVLLPEAPVDKIKFDKQNQGSLHVWDLN